MGFFSNFPSLNPFLRNLKSKKKEIHPNRLFPIHLIYLLYIFLSIFNYFSILLKSLYYTYFVLYSVSFHIHYVSSYCSSQDYIVSSTCNHVFYISVLLPYWYHISPNLLRYFYLFHLPHDTAVVSREFVSH